MTNANLLFWVFIAAAIGAVMLMIGCAFLAYRVRARYQDALFAYVQRRYPDEWHMATNLRWLGWIGSISLIAIAVALLGSSHSLGTGMGLLLCILSFLVMIGADVAFTLQKRLTAQTLHQFVSQSQASHLVALTVEQMSPQIQSAAQRLSLPAALKCKTCGEARDSSKHVS